MKRHIISLLTTKEAQRLSGIIPVIRKEHAYFCLDCDSIFQADGKLNSCSACTSQATVPVANWLFNVTQEVKILS